MVRKPLHGTLFHIHAMHVAATDMPWMAMLMAKEQHADCCKPHICSKSNLITTTGPSSIWDRMQSMAKLAQWRYSSMRFMPCAGKSI